ncbi:MAG: RDD family protein [Bryobacteraceae bacterium]
MLRRWMLLPESRPSQGRDVFCNHCQAPLTPGAQFCDRCGGPVAPAPLPPPAYAVQPYGQPQYGQPPYGQPNYPPQGYGPSQPQLPYATWADRVLGYIIDQVMVIVAMIGIYVVAGGLLASFASMGSDAAGGLCCLLIILFPVATLAVGFYNRVYLVSLRGYSIGQGIMKLRVISPEGRNLSMGTAFVRLLAQLGLSLIPILGLLDLLFPLWDDKRQTLHDKAVGCFVIKDPLAL